jgi:hypothetical protein
MLNNKDNCIGDLSAQTHGTGGWRRGLDAKYNDSRNRKAADALARLSFEVKDLTDSQWSQLQPYWSSNTWSGQFHWFAGK